MNPTNFYNKLNNSGYMPNITNNINIKNVNIINSNEPFNFNNNELPFFNSINVNNDLNNNIINNNYYRQNQNINFFKVYIFKIASICILKQDIIFIIII